MAKNTFAGRIVEIGEIQRLGKDPAKPFLKRGIVIEEDGDSQYPNKVEFEFTGQRVQEADKLKVGMYVGLTFFLHGSEWKDPKTGKVRHFLSAKVGFIKEGGLDEQRQAPAESAPTAAQGDEDALPDEGEGNENLPF